MRYSIFLCLFLSCSSYDTENILVNSYKVPCEGVAPMQCLQISAAADANRKWKNHYGNIEGFEYQPGFIYELEVRREQIDNPPADAASFRWVLVREVSKRQDPLLRINDIWALTHMQQESYEVMDGGRNPILEVHIADQRFVGNAFCNGMNGQLEKLQEGEIRFGLFAMTKMLCPAQSEEDEYLKYLDSVRYYEIDGTQLALLDSLKDEVLRYKKID